MNGKEFKEEISKIEVRNSLQTYFAVDKMDEDKIKEFMLDNGINFDQYRDHGLLFSDKESISILNSKIKGGHFNIEDDKELKVSPVTFVNKVMTSVYDRVICEDLLSNDISNEVESVFDSLMDDTIDASDDLTKIVSNYYGKKC